jgi:cell division septation protein DedD
MPSKKFLLACSCALLIGLAACSRQQSEWQKTREANTAEAYEQFLKKYPSGEFTAQAQARLKELEEERDWQKARDADTLDAYQAFLKQYPEGKWTEEARIRIENFTLAQTPTGTQSAAGSPPAAGSGSAAASGGAPAAGSAMEGSPPPGAAMTGSPPPGSSITESAPPLKAVPKISKSRPAPASESATAPKGISGKYAVQLGAFKSGSEAANKRWEKLQKEYPKLFAGISSKVVPKKTQTGTLYRLQAVGMSESHAARICKDLKAKSQPCVIVRPAHA